MRNLFLSSLVATASLTVLVACPQGSTVVPPPPANGPGTCDVDGASVTRPDEAALRPEGGAVNLGCVGNPQGLEQSAAVQLQGCIDIFGLGGRAKRGIKVAVFGEDQDPRNDAPDFGEVDIAVVEDATGLDCAVGGANEGEAACLSLDCSKEGAYVIQDIPVHVPLTMKVYAIGDETVIDTYTFGIVFDYGDAPAVDGIVNYEANLIFASTWQSIPTLAGRQIEGGSEIGDGEGRAVIAGEIRDCDDTIVQGASVTSSQSDVSTKITYFDGDTEDPTPDLARLSTNTDGLYVILNATTAAGKNTHTVTAGMLDPACATLETAPEDCQCVSLSTRSVMAFPDSVSIATLRGDLPTLN